jgi:hypothetical protein
LPETSRHTDAGRKGKAVEHLVAASVILASGGELNASTSVVDDESVDIVFHRRNRSRTLAVQVKSRFWDATPLSTADRFGTNIRDVTFRPRSDLYMLFVAVRAEAAEIGPLWLVPSEIVAQRTRRNDRGLPRFVASGKETSRDQWSEYRISAAELPNRLLAILGEV